MSSDVGFAGGVKQRRRGNKTVKHAVKWIADQKKNSVTVCKYLQSAPNGVIKGIVNAALNLEQNPGVNLSKNQKRFFARKRKYISFLTNPKIGFQQKRKALQAGGFIPVAILALILTTVIGALATKFLSSVDLD